MSDLLPNHLAGRWQAGRGPGTALFDPVLGTELVRVDNTGLDLEEGFEFARREGGAALRAMSYAQRAGLLGAVQKVLQGGRDAYYEISTANSGTVQRDTAIDVDGAIYTVGVYARLGAALGERAFLLDEAAQSLSRDGAFQSQHVLVPGRGVALFINAFNFPSWGLWEKAAPALLSGVPVIVKPATATAWLTQRMVADVIEAGVLPPGALSVVCGSSAGMLDALRGFDFVSFTGSAHTASLIRSHPAVAERSVRVNIEADSLNSALLLPGQDDAALQLLASEVVREMSVKSGQKCTAIRRVLVPENRLDDAVQAIAAGLRELRVGNPRNPQASMGSLVSREQREAVLRGMGELRRHAAVLHDGATQPLLDACAEASCCVAPLLLGLPDAAASDAAREVHELEVFGPVATVLPYRDTAQALELARRGGGSLVASLYGSEAGELAAAALELADSHGRVHVVTPQVAPSHTGHGNVMPQSLHGGPGRAGGGEELGGLRALRFYHRRSALQASGTVLGALPGGAD